MMGFDPRVWIASFALLVVIGAGCYLKGRSDGRALERDAAANKIEEWRINADAAYSLYLQERDRKQIEYRTITKTVEAAKNATPDIPDCRTGDDWLRIFRENAAIANGAAVPTGSGSADRADAR